MNYDEIRSLIGRYCVLRGRLKIIFEELKKKSVDDAEAEKLATEIFELLKL